MAEKPGPSSHTETELQALSDELLAERTLILCSNRGPVEFTAAGTDQWEAVRGSGGLVTAMSAASRLAAGLDRGGNG